MDNIKMDTKATGWEKDLDQWMISCLSVPTINFWRRILVDGVSQSQRPCRSSYNFLRCPGKASFIHPFLSPSKRNAWIKSSNWAFCPCHYTREYQVSCAHTMLRKIAFSGWQNSVNFILKLTQTQKSAFRETVFIIRTQSNMAAYCSLSSYFRIWSKTRDWFLRHCYQLLR